MDKIDKALEKFRSSKKYKRKDAHWGQVHRTRDNNPAKNPEAQKKRIKNYDWDKVSRKQSKLSKEDILEMKKVYKKDKSLSCRELGEMYSISTQAAIQYLSNSKKVNFGPPVEIRKLSITTCEHCGRTIKSESNFKRWHGDNCKKAPNAIPRGYKAHKHYPIYRELTTGFTGTNMELLNRFPKLNTPSIMNSANNNKPLERGFNKGLHFEKVV